MVLTIQILNMNTQAITHMSRKTVLLSLAAIIAAAVIISLAATSPNSPKIAYINTAEVYNDFALKKELESKLDDTQAKRKSILDSLKVSLQGLSMRMEKKEKPSTEEIEEFNYVRQQYIKAEQEFSEDNQALADQYSEQIWKQLNQYIADYGKEHGYKYILGANGEGVVMYADESDNITAKMMEYVNIRYGGKK